MPAKAPTGSRRRRASPFTRVILVDEFPIFSEALGRVISLEKDLDHVGSATSSEEAVQLVKKRAPEVAVVDIDVPTTENADFDGIDAAKRIKEASPQTRVLILTGRMDIDTMARAAADGACGFLPKTSNLADICQAIRTARDGGMFVERELVAPLIDRLHSSARQSIGGGSSRAALTSREQDVLTLLGEGLDVTVIARRLGVKVNTCRSHVKNILVKLGSHSQLEAVVEAVHQGLLPHLSR